MFNEPCNCLVFLGSRGICFGLNFSCKESASKCIEFGPQMRRLNSETISVCGGIWGDFSELLERLSFAKEIALKNLAWESLLKLTIKGIVC